MNQYIGFSVNSSEYMIPILKVREIIGMPSVTALPHMPGYVRGISNLRGNIIPIVNLKNLLDSECNECNGNIVIVIATGKITFGIIVDEITGVVNADESDIEPPDSFFKNNADAVEGVAKLDNKLIVLLNTRNLLPLEDMSLLEENIINVEESSDGVNVEVTKEVDSIAGKVRVTELHNAKEYFRGKLDRENPKHNVGDLMINFINALEAQEYEQVEVIVEQLGRETEGGLFREVGNITRKLHTSLEEFKGSLDNGIQRLTKDDVPSAVDKLQFVMSKTEDAANRTMGIVERYFEESDEFARQVREIGNDNDRVSYLESFKSALDDDMTSILTAQQFQDITGQTIKKVINLVNNVESELLSLVSKFGMSVKTEAIEAAGKSESSPEELTERDNAEEEEKVSQSDVEAMLNDFGF